MKALNIHFFSSAENTKPASPPKKERKPATVILTGYISWAGKLVIPATTMVDLGVDLDKISFKVGIADGKRKVKSLYLVPTREREGNFSFAKAAKSYTLNLAVILTKSGVDFSKAKYGFTIHLFEYEGTTAFDLRLVLKTASLKVPYLGKPRGRKPKVAQAAD
jgi:hypothetical protein